MADDPKINDTIYNKFKAYADQDVTNTDRAKLTEVKELALFDEEIYNLLLPFYQSSNPASVRFASLLNSIYTQGNNIFLITVRLQRDLLAKDPNQTKITSANTEAYKAMMSFALGLKIIKVLREPIQRSEGVTGRTGVYELVNPDFLIPLIRMIGEKAAQANKDSVLEWYDRTIANEKPVEKPIVEVKPNYSQFELEMKGRLMNSLDQKLTPENAFAAWRGYLTNSGSDRWLYKSRKEHIQQLVVYLKQAGVEHEDALSYKRMVVDALVHKKGQEGKGEYKDWKSNVEDDFTDLVNYAYIENPTPFQQNTKTAFKEDVEIMTWLRNKYGPQLHQLTVEIAHDIESNLYIQFLNEFYKRQPRSK